MRTELQLHVTTAPESLDPTALAAAKLVGS
jgi:hypothetical protein